jgi:CheY-like chemotaxis protein
MPYEIVNAARARRDAMVRWRAGPEPMARRASMKLLIIEDDRETAAYLVKGLSESGYTVDHSSDGRDGLFLATSGSYDAIILDRMLPGMDGLALVQRVRRERVATPVIILSARRSIDDRIKGLHTGADDYEIRGDNNIAAAGISNIKLCVPTCRCCGVDATAQHGITGR